ncbi:MAG: putative Ig domain-containing protein [Acidobacteriota bacterium]|nr:putative Ig domain-containing protein [Acidobacteriota bacterium]
MTPVRSCFKVCVIVLFLAAAALHCSRSSSEPAQKADSGGGKIAILTTGVLRLGYLGRPYLAVFKASAGAAPYHWTLISGQIPKGLKFARRQGKITGSPAQAGEFAFTIAVSDSAGASAQKTFNLKVFDLRLDEFGGLMSMPSPRGGTGFFRLEKFGRRWLFVTPAGHGFWLMAVQSTCPGALYPDVMKTKYSGNGGLWGNNTTSRLLSWGFNALGEFTSTCISPIGAHGGNFFNEPRIPVIIILNPVLDSMRNPPAYELRMREPIKDITAGVPQTTFSGYRGHLPDIYDPKFATVSRMEVAYWMEQYTGGFADKSWILGITTDDADDLFGFKSKGDAPINNYQNPAFMAATARFEYTAAENTRHISWIDPKLYSKYAWIDFLKKTYHDNIAALNSAWGTRGFYTSFDDAGGYGAGKGVIDEDGRHTAWMGNDPYMLTGAYNRSGSKCYLNCKPASKAVRADLNSFLYLFARQYAETVVGAIRAVDKHHLIFGPDAINNYGAKARDAILKGLADGGIDAFIWNYNPNYGGPKDFAGSMAEDNQSYDLTGKPAYIWYSVIANRDSGLNCTTPPYAAPMFASQKVRGDHYANIDMPAFLNAHGSNGDHYVLGIDWWGLYDDSSECADWGLLTKNDNAYDGREAVREPAADSWGFATGGEKSNYGDFLDSVRRANLQALEEIGGGK